jgi:hypothetical protein
MEGKLVARWIESSLHDVTEAHRRMGLNLVFFERWDESFSMDRTKAPTDGRKVYPKIEEKHQVKSQTTLVVRRFSTRKA